MSIEVCGYCTAGAMTPEIVEALVVETEQAIGEPITHTSDGGRLLWITEEPLDFCNETHRLRYCALLSALSSHAIA